MGKFKTYSIIVGLFFTVSPSFGQLKEFKIQSYFYGSKPANIGYEDFFKQLREEYNFNAVYVISNPGVFNFDQACKAVKKAGLKSILRTGYLRSWSTVFYENMALQDLNKYSGSEYDAIGYQVMDEPNAKTSFSPHGFNKIEDGPVNEYIDNLPQYIDLIRTYDDKLLRYANLFPIGVFPGDNYKEYREEYLQKYIDDSHPNILSFDHYPIYNSHEPVYDFFISLYSFALKSSENRIPFVYVLTPFKKFADYYDEPVNTLYAKGMNEFNYVIYAALAYGAKGISYWPGVEWVVTRSKDVKLEYDPDNLSGLSSLHKKLIDNSDELLSLNFVSAYHRSARSTIGDRTEKLYDFNLWKNNTRDVWSNNFTNDVYAQQIFKDVYSPLYEPFASAIIPNELVVTFLVNKSGQVYFWLFNKSLERPLSLVLNLRNPVRDVLNRCNVADSITLEPGEGKLFTSLTPTNLVSAHVDNVIYGDRLYPLTVHDELAIGASSKVIFDSGATKSFCANSISIKSMHAKEGSLVRFISYKNSNVMPDDAAFSKSYVGKNPTTADKLALDKDYYIYPNPVDGNELTLHADLNEGETLDVVVCDISGRIIKSMGTSFRETRISVEDIPSGVFFVSFRKGKEMHHLKVIKK